MRLTVAAVVVLASCSRGGHAIDAVKEMRSQACAGDPAAFFRSVDRKAVTEAMTDDAEDKISEEAAKIADPREKAAFRQGAESAMDMGKIVQETFSEWEDDIKHGEQSSLCRMSVIDADEHESAATVHVRTPSGKDRWWRLSRFGKRWLVVKIGGQR